MKTTPVIMLALFLAAGIAQADGESGYTFTIDGKPFDSYIISLDADHDNPKVGDLIYIGNHLLTLGKQKKCDFITTKKDGGRVLLKDGDKKRVVSVRVTSSYDRDSDTWGIHNPLAKLSAAEVKGLWGLVLDEWPTGIEKKLSEIDPTRTCVTVTHNTAQGENKSFPKLPVKLRYLCVDESVYPGIEDYESLGRLNELRALIMQYGNSVKLDLRHISKNKHLRYLDLTGKDFSNEHALASLTELRELNMSFCTDLKSVAFARGMKQLRFLELSRSGVSDLSGLGGLPKLQRVGADRTPVSKLPKRRLPALRELRVMSTRIAAEAVRAFRKAHPKSIVSHGWTDAFVRAVKNATRIRVRSGGTCHTRSDLEATLFEVKDAKEIKAFVANVRVDDARSGPSCDCCGDPTIEFYEDKTIVASLSVHHGQSLRWPGGWPGGAALVKASGDYIVKWLADRGVKGPQQQRLKKKKSDLALRRRWDRWFAVMPDEVARRFQKAKSTEDEVAIFEDVVKDGPTRARLYLRMWGVDEASWDYFSGLDQLLKNALQDRVSEQDMTAALKSILRDRDQDSMRGVARWLFGEYKAGKIKPKILALVIPSVARTGLASPRRDNRKQTINVLHIIGSREAVAALRECLGGKVKPRELPREQETEPGGMVRINPRDNEVKDACSDRAHAALCLAKLGDRQSLAAIRALHKEAKGEDRKVLDKTLGLLKAAKKKDE